MITNPKYGWCNFKLGDFEAIPSYLTNIPLDLLNCFIEYFKNGQALCWFDCEGEEFTLVLNPNSTFIIYEEQEDKLFYIKDNVYDMAKELCKDIRDDLGKWIKWGLLDDEYNMYGEQKEIINNKLKELENFIDKSPKV